MFNLYREDLFFADRLFLCWTTKLDSNSKEGFETFSVRFARLYPGYLLDLNMKCIARQSTPVLNLKQLIHVLRSNDEDLWFKSKWMFEQEFKFLDGSPNLSNKVAFSSYPRSGNTFLRKYFEMLTGVQTGSDNPLHFTLDLQMMNLKGEAISDDRVWIVKTHSPIIQPFTTRNIFCNKMIVVVRNPLDSILSFLGYLTLANHNSKLPFEVEKTYPEFWDWYVHNQVVHIKNWFKVVLGDARLHKVPTLFVRFEDLVANP